MTRLVKCALTRYSWQPVWCPEPTWQKGRVDSTSTIMHSQTNKNKQTWIKKWALQQNWSLKVSLLEDPHPALTKTTCAYRTVVLCLCVSIGMLFATWCTWFCTYLHDTHICVILLPAWVHLVSVLHLTLFWCWRYGRVHSYTWAGFHSPVIHHSNDVISLFATAN